MGFFAKNSIKFAIAKWTLASDVKKFYRNANFNSELFSYCFVKHGGFLSDMVKLYLSRNENGYENIDNVWATWDNDGIKMSHIPRRDYQVEYNNYYDGIIENKTVIMTWENANEKYIIIPAVENDSVLKKYHIDAGYSHFILRFIDDELADVGGIDRQSRQSYYFTPDDFPKLETGYKPRILQAPIIALYTPGLYVKGLREAGYQADQMILSESGFGWLLEEKPDFDLDIDSVSVETARARKVEFLVYALKNYDIFHLHSNWSMLGYDLLWTLNCDMGYLKKMGKKIVSSVWGMCDVTLKGTADQFEWIKECDVCTQLRPVRCESDSYTKMIQVTQKYSDIRLSNGRGCVVFSDIIWVDNAIDVKKYSPAIKNRIPEKFQLPESSNLRIYHSFGNAEERDDVKGTRYIREAVEKLQQEGYAVEFMFFDKVSHNDLKYYQVQADIVIDQLYCGWYGSTGVECLALGKVVITYVNPSVEEFLKNKGREIPVISANAENIYEVLKEVIANKQMRLEYEQKARRYAEKYHDYKAVQKELAQLYGQIYDINH